MKDLITSIFGTYVPQTYLAIGTDGNPMEIIPAGVAGLDWSWILGALLFSIFLWSILRIVGCFFKR